MKFRKLTIRNIGSIVSKTIDFTASPLDEASLFLISGKTGSGKSIILDCICLALYGNAARLQKAAGNDKYIDEGFNSSADGSISLSDPRQLVRRGTVSAMAALEFEGNDGRIYTASWSVDRGAKAKVDQRLSAPHRKLECADGSLCVEKVAEVLEYVSSPAVVGLSFRDFCRTTLLAQGEFTKFLDSSVEEKATILEKVTGTGKFSRIGTMINERYKQREAQKDKLVGDLNDPEKRPMDKELRKAVEKELGDLGTETAKLTDEKDILSARKGILERAAALDVAEEKYGELLARAGEKQKSEGYLKARKDSQEWKASAEVRAELKRRSDAESLRSSAQGTVRILSGTFVSLYGNLLWLKDSLHAYDGLEKAVEDKKAEIEAAANDRKALDPESLEKEGVALSAEKASLERIMRMAGIWQNDRRPRLTDAELAELPEAGRMFHGVALSKAQVLWDAQDRFAAAKRSYEDVLGRFQDHAAAVRATLSVGDICPVCGNIVKELFTDEKIQSVLKPLRDDMAKADEDVKEAVSGLSAFGTAMLAAVGEVESRIGAWRQKNAKLTAVSDRISRLTTELNGLNGKAAEKTAIAATISRVGQYVPSVSQSLGVAIPGDAERKQNRSLESGWVNLYGDAGRACSDLEKAGTAIAEADKAVDAFLAANPGIGRQRLEELSKLTQADIQRLDADIKRVDDAITTATAQLAACRDDRAALETEIREKGYAFTEEDTAESLGEAISAIGSDITAKNVRTGEIRNALRTDDGKISAMAVTQKAYDDLMPELTRYEILNGLFGQGGGVLFKRVAQSYLLGVLLENANWYLSQFTGRYELLRQEGSLVVLIRDREQDDAPRPVNTLSGGEGFMASLALALGLSSFSSSGFSSDTIFIDEGFGTLSPEYLTSVYAALSSLKDTLGKKVGIISHIDELKELIHPQIFVEPKGGGISEIHDPQ